MVLGKFKYPFSLRCEFSFRAINGIFHYHFKSECTFLPRSVASNGQELNRRGEIMLFAELQRKTAAASLAAAIAFTSVPAYAQAPREGVCEPNPFVNHNPGPGSLKGVPVPEPPNLGDFIRNRQVAIALGKALFWDMQVGSDGIQACASCHFRAGADPRSKNQLNPGGVNNANTTINLGGPNYQLQSSDYPFHKVQDPTNRLSTVLRDIDDVTSSQGVKLSQFLGVTPGADKDNTAPVFDPTFNIGGVNTRRADTRNTHTIFTAAFT